MEPSASNEIIPKAAEHAITDFCLEHGPKLQQYARRHLKIGRPYEDSEHIANAVLRSVISHFQKHGVENASPEGATSSEIRDGLWPLAIHIAKMKAKQANRDEGAAKRGGYRKEEFHDDLFADTSGEDVVVLAIIAEEIQLLRTYVADNDDLASILRCTLSGDTPGEVMRRLSLDPNKVYRGLSELRHVLLHHRDQI